MNASRIAAASIYVVVTSSVYADVVYLKDGFALHGKVRREVEMDVDKASGQAVRIDKPSNYFIMDDRARFMLFGIKLAHDADNQIDIREDHMLFSYPASAGLLDANLLPRGFAGVKLSVVTPYCIRLEDRKSLRGSWYLTSELGPELTLSLLRQMPEFQPAGDDFDKRLLLYRFCTQAGWYKEAEAELRKLETEFPDQSERIAAARGGLKRLTSQEGWQQAERFHRCGQHTLARALLNEIAIDDLDPRVQGEFAALQTRYENLERQLQDVKRMLKEVEASMPPAERSTVLANAIALITSELNYDTVDRLDAFRSIAGRHREGGPTANDQLALAVTGWILGRDAAEARQATAERLWLAREFVLKYQRSPLAAERKMMLDQFSRLAPQSVEEMAQVIASLPPPEPVTNSDPRRVTSLERETKLPWARHGPFRYQVVLPPDYHPNRTYPTLMVLPHAGDTTVNTLTPWITEAARHGFILLSPNWGGGRSKYDFTPEEHAAVLDCLNDAARSVSIDSNRVFLAGYGEGGTMAYDVGLSHPDLFAGVLPIGGRPRDFANTWYWKNAQQLPFYCVIGDGNTKIREWAVNLHERFASRGYNALLVIYKGRGSDFFVGEVPMMLDWMSRKRRAAGFPDLGRSPGSGFDGEEYQTFRATDNQFFWLSTQEINEKYLLKDFVNRNLKSVPAAMAGSIRENNHIYLWTRGVRQLSVWLGRTSDGAGGSRTMVDFDKPVRFILNRNTVKQLAVTPSLSTLLEDYYTRGDRQRLFYARVDFNDIR